MAELNGQQTAQVEKIVKREAHRAVVTWPVLIPILATLLMALLGLGWSFHSSAKEEIQQRYAAELAGLKELMKAEFENVKEQLKEIKQARR
jgi:Tfp pilus assembly protein PilO